MVPFSLPSRCGRMQQPRMVLPLYLALPLLVLGDVSAARIGRPIQGALLAATEAQAPAALVLVALALHVPALVSPRGSAPRKLRRRTVTLWARGFIVQRGLVLRMQSLRRAGVQLRCGDTNLYPRRLWDEEAARAVQSLVADDWLTLVVLPQMARDLQADAASKSAAAIIMTMATLLAATLTARSTMCCR